MKLNCMLILIDRYRDITMGSMKNQVLNVQGLFQQEVREVEIDMANRERKSPRKMQGCDTFLLDALAATPK